MIATRSTFQPLPRSSLDTVRPRELSIDVLRTGAVAVLGVSGRLSGSGSQHLRRTLDQLITEGCRELTVHLDTTESLDSMSLQVLRGTRSQLTSVQGEFTVTSRVAATRTMLAMIGVGDDAA